MEVHQLFVDFKKACSKDVSGIVCKTSVALMMMYTTEGQF
jgi:hypothetical protein